MYRQYARLFTAVNTPPLAALCGALAIRFDGIAELVALAGIPACTGLLVLALYRLLDFED